MACTKKTISKTAYGFLPSVLARSTAETVRAVCGLLQGAETAAKSVREAHRLVDDFNARFGRFDENTGSDEQWVDTTYEDERFRLMVIADPKKQAVSMLLLDRVD